MKKIITKPIYQFSKYDFSGKLEDIIEKLRKEFKDGEDLGYKDLEIDVVTFGENDVDFNLTGKILESDIEYRDRLATEKIWKDAQDTRDKADFERLKKKFEKS